MVADQARQVGQVGGLQAGRDGVPLFGVVVDARSTRLRCGDLLGLRCDLVLSRALERDIPDERAQESSAVQLTEQELVVAVEPVGVRQQIRAAARATGQRVEAEVEALAVGVLGAQRDGSGGKQLRVLTHEDDAVSEHPAARVALGHDADRLGAVVRIGGHDLDRRRIEVAQPHHAGDLVHERGQRQLAEDRPATQVLGQTLGHAVDRIGPPLVQPALVRVVFHLQAHAFGQQVGDRQLDEPVRELVALPQPRRDLLHAQLGHGREVSLGVSRQPPPAFLVVLDGGAGGLGDADGLLRGLGIRNGPAEPPDEGLAQVHASPPAANAPGRPL